MLASPHTILNRSAHSIDAAELQRDDEKLAGCGRAVVEVVRHFAIQDRDIVQIEFASATNAAAPEKLVVTASQVFPALESCPERSQCLRARKLIFVR